MKNLIILGLIILPSLAMGAEQDYWPTKEWKSKPLETLNVNQKKFDLLMDYIWDKEAKYKTDAFLIIKDGYIVYEGYDRGHDLHKKHMFWSFSKSLTNILIGIAVKKKIVRLDDYVHQYYPTMKRERASDVKLQHVLNMSSGFRFYEEHPLNIILSDSIYVYYSEKNRIDAAKSITERKMKHAPGTQFNYGTHEPILAMGILKKAIGNK